MNVVKWTVGAIVTFGLAALTLTIASRLMPPGAVSYQKGTIVPWAVTWGMVWVTALSAIVVGGNMVLLAMGKGDPETTDHSSASYQR